ncbi:periplasmic heavy metal sensor [Salipiger sp. HF18]|uniref:periplasmic heavy metal sensor n=1 Tax=Salipiger sp. HF18 TaxID=2721557 RepID=UPI00142DC4DD|nr:periplasmic heavy metal sensor [Salipiger sp. HF18]NIY98933.1 periplasmic heavy metal sensor [Salipiger sp. HF18]
MADAESRPKMRRGLRVLLFASLALNLAVVGVGAGFVLRHPMPERAPPPRGRDFVFPYTSAFSEEQRRELGRNLRQSFKHDRAQGGERPSFVDGYNAALELLRAEPFDSAAFGATLEAQSARGEARQKAGQRLLVDYVATLDPEERRAYADRLEAEIAKIAEHAKRFRPKD